MRSWLYCPGNNPKMITNACIYGADGLVFDLEDAVSISQKDEARSLIAQAFRDEIVPSNISAVRINGFETEFWQNDLKELIKAGVGIIRIPKVETAGQIKEMDRYISQLESDSNIVPGYITLQCIFETPLGVENAFIIGNSSKRISSFSFGAEDYCTALGINRGLDLLPLDYPRSRIASAAAAFGYNAYDTVWGFLNDTEGLKKDALRAKSLGFHGKSLIHPEQINVVNTIFSPSKEDIEKAKCILEKAETMGKGVTSVDGRMIDLPVINRAKKILQMDKEHDK